jgi:multidrug efflux pump subunit AcrA (membrane-fusion protein)
LSTLTKILIVLLTVTSILLCGLVATYVANAENFRQKYDQAYQELRGAERNAESAKSQQLREREEADREKAKLNEEIAALKIDMGKLQTQLTEAEREKQKLLQRVDNFAAIVEGFTKTNDQQGLLLKNTIARLETVEADLIKERSQHKETNQLLLDKMASLSTLDERNKQLVQEKTELQTKLDQLLLQYGKVVVPAKPVTPITTKARPAPPLTRDVGLKGQVTSVDLKNQMAAISIGQAHGVKEGMKFHVIRGDQFVCDILILDVQPERAVGILELLKPEQPPRINDEVSTNL